MKKIFISVVALAVSVMTMATVNTRVQIKLTGETGGANSVYLYQDDAYTSAYESGVDVEQMMSQANSKSVLMYGFVGSLPCENIVTNDLTGIELGFTTNQVDQNYTLTFSNFMGTEFVLYDKIANQLITINASTPAYAFSVEAAQVGQVAVNDRFVIGAPAPAVKAICFNYNKLELTKYAGATVEVFADGAATASVTENIAADATTEIDLNALASGKYKVVISGIATPEEYIIDVKPAVTVVP